MEVTVQGPPGDSNEISYAMNDVRLWDWGTLTEELAPWNHVVSLA